MLDWQDCDFRRCGPLAQLNMTTLITGLFRHFAGCFRCSLGRLPLPCIVSFQIQQNHMLIWMESNHLHRCFGAQPNPEYFRGEKVWFTRSARQAHGCICNNPASVRLEKDWPKLPTSNGQGVAFHLVPNACPWSCDPTSPTLPSWHFNIGSLLNQCQMPSLSNWWFWFRFFKSNQRWNSNFISTKFKRLPSVESQPNLNRLVFNIVLMLNQHTLIHWRHFNNI